MSMGPTLGYYFFFPGLFPPALKPQSGTLGYLRPQGSILNAGASSHEHSALSLLLLLPDPA